MVVKGKEKQAVGELYNIIETVSHSSTRLLVHFLSRPNPQLSDEIWPKPPATELAAPEGDSDSEDSEDDQDIEQQLAKEPSDINKKKPKGSSERRIGSSSYTQLYLHLTSWCSKLPNRYRLWYESATSLCHYLY